MAQVTSCYGTFTVLAKIILKFATEFNKQSAAEISIKVWSDFLNRTFVDNKDILWLIECL